VLRRRRHISEIEMVINDALCGLPWEEAQLLRPKLVLALGLRNDVEEIFREAQRRGKR
jgi:hypothetical protein